MAAASSNFGSPRAAKDYGIFSFQIAVDSNVSERMKLLTVMAPPTSPVAVAMTDRMLCHWDPVTCSFRWALTAGSSKKFAKET